MKKLAKILLVILVLLLVVRGGYWLYTYYLYANELKKQKEVWVSETFIPSKIEGRVYQFNDPTGENCFTNLIIKKADGERFASGVCLCDSNRDFAQFVAVGDSVYKPEGSQKIIVIKSNNEKREFDFPFCDH